MYRERERERERERDIALMQSVVGFDVQWYTCINEVDATGPWEVWNVDPVGVSRESVLLFGPRFVFDNKYYDQQQLDWIESSVDWMLYVGGDDAVKNGMARSTKVDVTTDTDDPPPQATKAKVSKKKRKSTAGKSIR